VSDIPTSVRLPAKLKAELEKVAKEERRPVSPLIVYILECWLRDRKKK